MECFFKDCSSNNQNREGCHFRDSLLSYINQYLDSLSLRID